MFRGTPPAKGNRVYLDLSRLDIVHVVNAQVGVADFLQPGIAGNPSPDRSYGDNETLWADLLAEEIDPYGKYSMLRGEIGCLPLRPRSLRTIGTLYYMSASACGVAHEGLPVAVPEHFCTKYIEQIKTHGALRCLLTGRLQNIPADDESLTRLFKEYTGVSKVYLAVEHIQPLAQEHTVEPTVTAAVSFRSNFEG